MKKCKKILTLKDSLNRRTELAPFEISLLMLNIIGYDEQNIFPYFDFALQPGTKPIKYNLATPGNIATYLKPILNTKAEELTNEVEALLINTFKPKYNEITFNNYPDITSGTRSVGYTQSNLVIEYLPAILRTATHETTLTLSDLSDFPD